MRRFNWTIFSPILWLAVCVLGALVGRALPAYLFPDYQYIAETTPWQWPEPIYQENGQRIVLPKQLPAPYHAKILSTTEDFPKYDVVIDDGKREVYRWREDDSSDFSIVGDRLYYVQYPSVSSGAEVFCVDLRTSTLLWESRCTAVGIGTHSKYFNEVILDADSRVVRIKGKEAAGQYIEFKDVKTGVTIGHRMYDHVQIGTPFWYVPSTSPPRRYPRWLPPPRASRFAGVLGGSPGFIGFILCMRKKWIRHRRASRGLCVNCGYDIRASSERCSECGNTLSSRAST